LRHTDKGVLRTSNYAEAWHQRWNELVERAHIGCLLLLRNFRRNNMSHDVEADIKALFEEL